MYERARHNQDIGPIVVGGLVGFAIGMALNPVRKAAMQGMEVAAGDWHEILAAEHRAVEKAFDKLLQTGPEHAKKRQLLLKQIAHALRKHAITEECVIYPALRTQNKDAVQKLGAEHLDIKAYLSRLQYDVATDDPAWLDTVRELRDLVVSHAREEEDDLFPQLRSSLAEEETAAMNRRLHWEGYKLA